MTMLSITLCLNAVDEMSILIGWLCVWLLCLFVNDEVFVKDSCKCNECISV